MLPPQLKQKKKKRKKYPFLPYFGQLHVSFFQRCNNLRAIAKKKKNTQNIKSWQNFNSKCK